MKSNLIELRISLRLLRFPEKIGGELGEFQDWLHMERIPHVVATLGHYKGTLRHSLEWRMFLRLKLRDALIKILRDYLGIFPNIGGEGGSSQFPKLL